MAKKLPSPKTVVRLNNSAGELNRIEIADDDATVEAIAEAAVALIASTGYALHEGDSITITAE